MTLPFSWPVLLLLGSIAQGVLLALLLLLRKKNQLANRFLGLLLLGFSLWLLDGFFVIGGIYRQDANYYFLPIFYSFSFGPLLYFYVRNLVNADFRFRGHQLWHFLPVVLQASLYGFLTLQSYAFRRWFWMEVHLPFTYGLEFYGTLLSLTVYGLAAIGLLRRYQHWLRENYSEYSRIRLQWLRTVLVLILLLCLLWTGDVLFSQLYWTEQWESIHSAALSLIMLVLGIGGIRQDSLGEVRYEPPPKRESAPEIDPQLLERIVHRMEREEDFREPDLSLRKFAVLLDTPPRKVSQHINHGLKQSFVDFVNTYRVAAVKERIRQGALEDWTLLAIALEAGFNSKATFNRVFRQLAGESPGEFAKKAS
ncbi:AraC family transcriptional regulator [Lewinella sp. W8]|uniref:helix-turn-helix domain-containing protein n=1 Tax=Lewinella sp. W8 TaxID=2528208 RepID=UPI0010676CB9|nr:AraC family transcriptional regulator [Lewinella sp. W8]MTB53210.1 helix-turn-helix domain-containing protein [Lewinella sp. W8]